MRDYSTGRGGEQWFRRRLRGASNGCDTRTMYSAAVLEHFKNPRNAGELDDATAVVEVTNPACGDVLRLSARVEGGRITAVRFKASGCVTAIACSSALTELLTGTSLAEAGTLTAQAIAGSVGRLPPATVHGSQLAADALQALLAQIKD